MSCSFIIARFCSVLIKQKLADVLKSLAEKSMAQQNVVRMRLVTL